jgi:hypothetical protein
VVVSVAARMELPPDKNMALPPPQNVRCIKRARAGAGGAPVIEI